MKVWYASYGSNLLKERFLAYIAGGSVPGGEGTQRGCQDKTLPVEDRPIILTRPILFRGESKRWGQGGVAFLDEGRVGFRTLESGAINPAGEAYGRAHHISLEQFWDVIDQENGRSSGGIERIDLEMLEPGIPRRLEGAGWYGQLVLAGDLDGSPVLTFTGGSELLPRPPSEAYLAVILSGISQAADPDVIELARYADSLIRRSQASLAPLELALSCSRGAWSRRLTS